MMIIVKICCCLSEGIQTFLKFKTSKQNQVSQVNITFGTWCCNDKDETLMVAIVYRSTNTNKIPKLALGHAMTLLMIRIFMTIAITIDVTERIMKYLKNQAVQCKAPLRSIIFMFA